MPGLRRLNCERLCLVESMTQSERRILQYLDLGLSNDQIATRLFVTINTIKYHLKNVYSKLGANSRLSAVHAARESGLI